MKVIVTVSCTQHGPLYPETYMKISNGLYDLLKKIGVTTIGDVKIKTNPLLGDGLWTFSCEGVKAE